MSRSDEDRALSAINQSSNRVLKIRRLLRKPRLSSHPARVSKPNDEIVFRDARATSPPRLLNITIRRDDWLIANANDFVRAVGAMRAYSDGAGAIGTAAHMATPAGTRGGVVEA